jgi:hypothetical protein
MKKVILVFLLFISVNALAQTKDSVSKTASTTGICICAPSDTTKKPPLYIIDGKLLKTQIYNLDPNNISKMEILKNDSLVTKYGPDAVNGVIIITTKSKNIDLKTLTNPKGKN